MKIIKYLREQYWEIYCHPAKAFFASIFLLIMPYVILLALGEASLKLDSEASSGKHEIIFEGIAIVAVVVCVISVITGFFGILFNYRDAKGYFFPYRVIGYGYSSCSVDVFPDGSYTQKFSGKMEHWRKGFLTKKGRDELLEERGSHLGILEKRKNDHELVVWDHDAE